MPAHYNDPLVVYALDRDDRQCTCCDCLAEPWEPGLFPSRAHMLLAEQSPFCRFHKAHHVDQICPVCLTHVDDQDRHTIYGSEHAREMHYERHWRRTP